VVNVKVELVQRLLGPCLLCERRCGVDRTRGEADFCGLGAGLQIGAFANLYNEVPFVGSPAFSVFVRGCALRCWFCYRPDELRARRRQEDAAQEMADVLDRAADGGSESWHFLEGNPDESLLAILEALTLARRARPVAWDSALLLTPLVLELLKGAVDLWMPDLKFGNDACALRVLQIPGYVGVLRRNLEALADEPAVVVQHMAAPGHEACCTRPVQEHVRGRFPRFALHTFPLVPVPARRPSPGVPSVEDEREAVPADAEGKPTPAVLPAEAPL
jgi:putative pyruvate formate lyase activating enzyme